MKLDLWDYAFLATSVVIIIGTALTAFAEFVWIGQDLAAIPALFFLIAVVVYGAKLVGRLKKTQGVNLFRLHRKIGVFIAVLIIVTFFHGIWDRIFMGEPFFWQHSEPLVTVSHGWLGLAIMVVALMQVVPSLVVKDRKRISRLHMIFGYTLLMLVVIQICLGFGAVLVELAGG